MVCSKTVSFGAKYLPSLSRQFPDPILEEFETLATMSWLSVTHKHVASVPAEDRMALVADRIPKMLYPNNPPYQVLAKGKLAELGRYYDYRSPETLEKMAIYSMMGLNTPNGMWPDELSHQLVRFINCDESQYGHIFRLKSKAESCSARVFGSYHPLGNSNEVNEVYLFFPTSGEYLAQRDDPDLKVQFGNLIFMHADNNCELHSCDVRGFRFEQPPAQSPFSCRLL